MSGSISRIMAKAYKNVLSNPREAKFAFRMQQLFAKSEKRRKKVKEQEGIEPTLPSGGDGGGLSPQQWHDIFTEAASMGINFSLLAGGEPMMRKDILEAVAEVKDMIFPIFTNGTLIGPSYMDFLRKNLNMVPIISIEGTGMDTDERRGQGVFRRATPTLKTMQPSLRL